jgi:hypothetical protein
MSSDNRALKLAVLIDADNMSAKIAKPLFEEIANLGEASIRRAYGDFTSSNLKAWVDALVPHAIRPHQNFPNTVRKNASDIALVIDAMDLLHTGRFDGFCIVSSDSDFTGLAARIREEGVDVYGFGERKAPESFRQACKRFTYTELLMAEANNISEAGQIGDSDDPAVLPPSDAIPLIQKALDQLDDGSGWVLLGRVGSRLSELYPDFHSRNYGQSKLGGLAERSGAFDTRRTESGHLQIRSKSSAS